jgi:hypothetical protein
MRKKVTIKFLNRQGLNTGLNRSDKGIVFRPKTCTEERNHFKVIEWFVHYSQCISELLESLIIVRDGGVALLEGGQLKMRIHRAGTGLRGKYRLQRQPCFSGGGTSGDMRKHILRERGIDDTEDQLVLHLPMEEFGIGTN